MNLDASILRLFPEVPPDALVGEQGEGYVTMRLLARGDSRDLRILFSSLSESTVRKVFLRRGRQLSRRDRAFWAVLLETGTPPEDQLSSELWPL